MILLRLWCWCLEHSQRLLWEGCRLYEPVVTSSHLEKHSKNIHRFITCLTQVQLNEKHGCNLSHSNSSMSLHGIQNVPKWNSYAPCSLKQLRKPKSVFRCSQKDCSCWLNMQNSTRMQLRWPRTYPGQHHSSGRVIWENHSAVAKYLKGTFAYEVLVCIDLIRS